METWSEIRSMRAEPQQKLISSSTGICPIITPSLNKIGHSFFQQLCSQNNCGSPTERSHNPRLVNWGKNDNHVRLRLLRTSLYSSGLDIVNVMLKRWKSKTMSLRPCGHSFDLPRFKYDLTRKSFICRSFKFVWTKINLNWHDFYIPLGCMKLQLLLHCLFM